ncbi:ABC transporter ATP-binding protein [Roseateles sp. SL47]|uniref:ABC transporter ATP-binding protein n=1 Tax=Roseateles sp. SL47 TaxID=2995138 RepID=UPI00226EC594|nr:ABC transporter ATP-binding protein [Roseateles sp. SL47]WAC75479.1 ABC transporter ATP-binding protein [Roseateles sp. SL47]
MEQPQALAAERTRIEIVDCAKTFPGGAQALHPTTLIVEPGEVLALLGPSGCGKTTLLRVIAGLVHPDRGGRIVFNDDDVTLRPIEQRAVGMVFQHYALFPQMTVEANIGYGLRVRGISPDRIRQRVGEVIDLVRLGGLELRRPAQLSGGQRQRVALARALAVRPRVLLLDEPLTALDAKLKETLRDELAQLLRDLHITAVHVTHDQSEALAIADRLAVMQAGRIMQVGRGEDLYRQPGHPFVAEFLGRVNRLRTDRQGALPLGGIELRCPAVLAGRETVLVRPEDVNVHVMATEQAHRAAWGAARVLQRTFLGDRVHLRLSVTGQDEAIVSDQPRDCSAAAGDTVYISIDPARLMAAALKDSA